MSDGFSVCQPVASSSVGPDVPALADQSTRGVETEAVAKLETVVQREIEQELVCHAQIIQKQQRLIERCISLVENLTQQIEIITAPARIASDRSGSKPEKVYRH